MVGGNKQVGNFIESLWLVEINKVTTPNGSEAV